jgi:hypothetical protein
LRNEQRHPAQHLPVQVSVRQQVLLAPEVDIMQAFALAHQLFNVALQHALLPPEPEFVNLMHNLAQVHSTPDTVQAHQIFSAAHLKVREAVPVLEV